ncbi:MAG: multifunctional CCA addition/repair protein [Gammaproteobacteria bacterium]|nr:multifunctional CCA addition/repair protein [Gammaproteobacteria bacterium]MDH5304433.1 multifunctional CCA addition/repair protein [Gammaproteobacteria bacterium]MDH5322217.1 multifunctional CCA addition/repair protein [Gammaproteobacteria bacterium]
MKVYLVGGAVRDEQLGIPVKERDWCVVGATPDELAAAGYLAVGKDFPVFLHPQSKEEYALARTERKTAVGYHGFAFNTNPGVSIEEDLSRRDLTINAMARDEDGKLIDPFGGADDARRGILRHVSDAFAEDPVRILRTAKFAARFAALGFRIAPETRDLMRQMVDSGEAEALVPDRVWKETEAALAGPDPRVFFEALRACRALRVLFPEVDALFGIPQPARWHPEIDSGLHTLMSLEQASRLSADVEVRFAALVHDLGKATTDAKDLPQHPGHEQRGCKLIQELCDRLPVPRACRELGLLAAEYHTHCHRMGELRDDTVVRVLEKTDAFRRPARFEQFLKVCEADARGRTQFENRDYPQASWLREAFAAAAAVDSAAIAREHDADRIAEAIRRARIARVGEARTRT